MIRHDQSAKYNITRWARCSVIRLHVSRAAVSAAAVSAVAVSTAVVSTAAVSRAPVSAAAPVWQAPLEHCWQSRACPTAALPPLPMPAHTTVSHTTPPCYIAVHTLQHRLTQPGCLTQSIAVSHTALLTTCSGTELIKHAEDNRRVRLWFVKDQASVSQEL